MAHTISTAVSSLGVHYKSSGGGWLVVFCTLEDLIPKEAFEQYFRKEFCIGAKVKNP